MHEIKPTILFLKIELFDAPHQLKQSRRLVLNGIQRLAIFSLKLVTQIDENLFMDPKSGRLYGATHLNSGKL